VIIDIPTIIIFGILETIADMFIFKVFGIKRLILYFTIFINFIIPLILIWFIARSDIPLLKQIPIVMDIFVSYWINIFNFVLSGAIGIIVSYTICMFTGERPESY
jgi:hypothetical protein